MDELITMFNRRYILLVVCLLPLITSGQEDNSSSPEALIGLSFAPNTDTRILPPSNYGSDSYKSLPFYGFSIGGFVRLPLSDKFCLQTGLTFIDLGYRAKTTLKPLNFPDIFGSTVPTTTNDPKEIETSGGNLLLSIPMCPAYYFGKGKWKYTLSIGPTLELWMYNYGKSIILYENGEKETSRRSYNYLDEAKIEDILDMGLAISFGFETSILGDYLLHIVPEWRMYSLVHFKEIAPSFRSYYISSGVKVVFSRST